MAKAKKVIQKEIVNAQKNPITIENPNSFYKLSPVWSFKILDNGYKKWGFIHVIDLNNTVISKLKNYEGMTWSEILEASG